MLWKSRTGEESYLTGAATFSWRIPTTTNLMTCDRRIEVKIIWMLSLQPSFSPFWQIIDFTQKANPDGTVYRDRPPGAKTRRRWMKKCLSQQLVVSPYRFLHLPLSLSVLWIAVSVSVLTGVMAHCWNIWTGF